MKISLDSAKRLKPNRALAQASCFLLAREIRSMVRFIRLDECGHVMVDFIKPIGAKGVDLVDSIDLVDRTTKVEGGAAAEMASAQRIQTGQPVDALQTAISEVAADIKLGNVPDREAASDAVIIRLVNLRFPHLTEAKRTKLLLHMHEVLHRDPQFQARIEELIALSRV